MDYWIFSGNNTGIHRGANAAGNPRRGVSRKMEDLMAALDWSECPQVESVPGKVSGAWVFRGTRMPVATVFDNLEAGASIDDIIEWFDGPRGTGQRRA
jgi:uncharacterized protein (DUF433 family)